MSTLPTVLHSQCAARSRCVAVRLFLIVLLGLLGVVVAQDGAVASETFFVGAKPDEAGLNELQAATQDIYRGLKAHADDGHPSIRYSSVSRKGEKDGCAYHFQYGQEGDFVLYHPADYHISLARDVKFSSGVTKEQVQAALHDAAIQWRAFPVNDFANGALIDPKNSGDGSTLRYFTFDFEKSPNQGDRTQQRQWVNELADDVSTELWPVANSLTTVNSYHISFGLAEAGKTASAKEIQEKVIRALKKYGGYHPLHSSQMQIDGVAVLRSSHIDDATRYTTYVEEPLSGILALPDVVAAAAVYKAPNMLLESGATWTVDPYDRTLLGQIDEAELPTLLDWVEESDALAVISGNQDSPDQGWLTVRSRAHFDVGVTSEEDTGHVVLGLKPGQVGSVLVAGADSRLVVGGDIDVGEYGYGLLEVNDQATVSSYGGYIGYRPGSNGAVVLRGPGTTWQVKNGFYVGYQGAGALNLSQGACLLGDTTADSYLYVGSETGSVGEIQLTDPGTQIQLYGGSMIVGSAGLGAVMIENQAAVLSASGYVGDEPTATGVVEIDGAGSRWNLTKNLWIGIEGSGNMSIQNGASVSCRYLTVAAYEGSTGQLTITDSESACNVTTDVFIGGWMDSDEDVYDRNDWNDGGAARVLIKDGGALTAGRTVWIGGHSLVQLLNGGSLNAENLDIMSGSVLLSTDGLLNISRQISVDGILQTDAPLQIGDGMSLVGNGWIVSPQTRLLAGSALSPGHSIGTLTFDGDLRFYSGSRLDVELANDGLCDRVTVSDTLTVGGTLALHGSGSPSWGYLFASAGHVTGALDAIDTSALSVAPKRVIFSDRWGLIKFKDLRDIANTDNARQVAGVLDASIDAGQSGGLNDRLIRIGNDQLMSRALDEMSGELYATLSSLGVQNTTNVYRVLSDRLRPDLVLGSSGFALSSGPSFSDDDLGRNLVFCGNRSDGSPLLRASPWGGWAIGYGLGGQARSDGNAHGVDYSTGGTLVAIERPLEATGRWGAFYGYGGARVTTQTVDQLADVDSHQFGAFVSNETDDDYCTLAGSMGYDNYRARRYLDFDAPIAALGDHHGWQSAAYLERGRSFRGQRWSLQPYGALQYIYLRQEAFVESRADELNLDVDGSNLNSFRGLLGSRLVRRLGDRSTNPATLSFRTIWMHEFLQDTTGLVSTGFASGPGPSFAIRGLDLGRDWVVLGPGCTYTVRDHVSLFANYDLQFNSQQVFHVGSGGVQFAW